MDISQHDTFTLKDFRQRTGLTRNNAQIALKQMVMDQRLNVGQRKVRGHIENVYTWNFNSFYNDPFNKGKKNG